jgi:hypothetical protein
MTDERDEQLFRRAADVLRAPGARDDDALADAIAAVRHEATDGGIGAAALRGAVVSRRRGPLMGGMARGTARGTARFIAGLAAGVAFAAGLGIGLYSGWRMRGASYRLAAEEVMMRGAPVASSPLAASPVSRVTLGAASGASPVQFMLVAPAATQVALVGEFNDWDPQATPMSRATGGAWHVAVPLANGRHVYAFVVDGSAWVSDPQAPIAPERWFGASNSVLLVNGVQRQ